MIRRQAAVAGSFYPTTKEAIEETIGRFDVAGIMPCDVKGIVAPHAGFNYSGAVAAKVYASANIADTVILIGPNHRGDGSLGVPPPAALVCDGLWEVPTGVVSVNSSLAEKLLETSELLVDDPVAHSREHSLEVQIPFLHKACGTTPSIVPILLSRISNRGALRLAQDLGQAIIDYDRPVTLVATTDFSHYVPRAEAEKADRRAIADILALDGTALMKRVRHEGISMCGGTPVAVMMEAAKLLGATEAELIDYRTSADTSGDDSSVVGYAGLIIR